MEPKSSLPSSEQPVTLQSPV